MTQETKGDARLHIPLTKLWPDIRVPGLPIIHTGQRLSGIISTMTGYACCQFGNLRADIPVFWSLDLSRPGASDILARRLAIAKAMQFPAYQVSMPRDYAVFRRVHPLRPVFELFWFGERFAFVPATHHAEPRVDIVAPLVDIDPKDDTRLDWNNLGSPRIVDLIALGLCAQHVHAQERG